MLIVKISNLQENKFSLLCLEEHKMEVRGVIGDTLNSAIDTLKNFWYKAKGLFTNAKVGFVFS